MNELKTMFSQRYTAAKATNAPVLITPESSTFLRGLFELTPQAAADMASIKRNRLLNFEQGGTALSMRDARWLQSVFETAGAEFFMGQSKLHVRVNGKDVMAYGEPVEELSHNVPLGDDCRAEREYRRWSLRFTSTLTGLSLGCILAVENMDRKNFFLSHQLALKQAFDTHPRITYSRPTWRY